MKFTPLKASVISIFFVFSLLIAPISVSAASLTSMQVISVLRALNIITDSQATLIMTILEDNKPTTPVLGTATISFVESKAATSKNVLYSGENASIHGMGLSGDITIKLGRIEPKYITVRGVSDSYAEFRVPNYLLPSEVSFEVINSSGKSSDPITIRIETNEISVLPIHTRVDYVQSPGSGRNVLLSGERAIVYGDNLSVRGLKVIMRGKADEREMSVSNQFNGNLSFRVPNVDAGNWDLFLKTTDGSQSNKIKLRVVDITSPVDNNDTIGTLEIVMPITPSASTPQPDNNQNRWSAQAPNNRAWGPRRIVTGAQSTTNGRANTDMLIARTESYPAAEYCANLNEGGFNDWYLPSRDELAKAWNEYGENIFTSRDYWSSTESAHYPEFTAWYLDMYDGSMYDSIKDIASSVRCLR